MRWLWSSPYQQRLNQNDVPQRRLKRKDENGGVIAWQKICFDQSNLMELLKKHN